jgi:hypothetical protein
MITFGVSVSIKLQAMWLSPFLFGLILARKIPYVYVTIPLAVYAATCTIPAIMGRSVYDLVTVYINQAGILRRLSSFAANPWFFFQPYSKDIYEWAVPTGVAFASLICLFYSLYVRRVFVNGIPSNAPKNMLLVNMALVSAILAPYILPKMHERYFFLADIIGMIMSITNPSLWYVGPLIVTASCIALPSASIGILYDLLPVAVILNGAALVIAIRSLINAQRSGHKSAAQP